MREFVSCQGIDQKSGKCQGKNLDPFVANFMFGATPVFSRLLRVDFFALVKSF